MSNTKKLVFKKTAQQRVKTTLLWVVVLSLLIGGAVYYNHEGGTVVQAPATEDIQTTATATPSEPVQTEVERAQPTQTLVPVIEPEITATVEVPAIEAKKKWFPTGYNFVEYEGVCYGKPIYWQWWFDQTPAECDPKGAKPIAEEVSLPEGIKVLPVGASIPGRNEYKLVYGGLTVDKPADGYVTVCKTQTVYPRLEGRGHILYSIERIEEGYEFQGRISGQCYTVESYLETELTQGLIWEALNQESSKVWVLEDTYYEIQFQTILTGNWFGDTTLTHMPSK